MTILARILIPLAFLLIPSLAHAANTWTEHTITNGSRVTMVWSAATDGTNYANSAEKVVFDVSAESFSNDFRVTYVKLCTSDASAEMILEWDDTTDHQILSLIRSADGDVLCTEIDVRHTDGMIDPGTAPSDILLQTTTIGASENMLVIVEGFGN